MPVRSEIIEARSPGGCRTLRLISDLLTIDILPELGGKIYGWTWQPLDHNFIWQNPHLAPAPLPYGTSYNENWCGGWDDLFPSCLPTLHAGQRYPDHGEYWTQPFEWEVSGNCEQLTAHLWAEGPFSPTRLERWLTLRAGSPVVPIRYRITHLGKEPLTYMWALHPALAVTPGCRLIIPAQTGVIASPGMGRLANNESSFAWPHAPAAHGGDVDLSRIPEATDIPDYEMVFLTGLRAGWMAMIDPGVHAGFGISFDPELFRTAWVFATYGGWQGLHTVVVEPSTSWPTDLDKAAAAERACTLLPGETLETEISVVVFTGRETVNDITRDGRVT